MFSNKIKDFFIKNNSKKKLSNVKHSTTNNLIKSIGIVLDEEAFHNKENLIAEIKKFGFQNNQIDFIVFKDKIKKTDVFNYPVFSNKDISWNATFVNKNVSDFITKNFDLLINYYNNEKAALLLLTHSTKADFKVGFKEIDNRLNHFIINEDPKNYQIFVEELFKYLKILKKI